MAWAEESVSSFYRSMTLRNAYVAVFVVGLHQLFSLIVVEIYEVTSREDAQVGSVLPLCYVSERISSLLSTYAGV